MKKGNEARCRQCGNVILEDQLPGDLCLECRSSSTITGPPPVNEVEPADFRKVPAGHILPDKIGPYKILELLGEGGMGDVYLAEQEKPIHRRVALKVIRLGMDTAEVIARFESERQALALMNHPNIAQVIDAGTTDRGSPYFVMEYVPGLSITQYCDKHCLDTSERLGIFIQVCEGVQHAHQKGIIHRDIKPSNILVAIQGDKPVPKIIDFGVAKAINQRLTEKTLYTQQGLLIGTPEYMSPEQAEMSGLDIDTRTDVYSLGALLYELLAGAQPFDHLRLRRLGYEAMQRKIRDEEPPRPSARVSSLGQASGDVAKKRRTSAAALTRQLHGDLDWITMKCLEKDRTRRYSAPSELAADIVRYLKHEPVLACPPSTTYRIQKFVKRHRFGVAAAALVVIALLAGISGTTIGLLRAKRAERIARQEAESTKQVSDFLVGLFEVSDPSESRGNRVTAREILDRGVERIGSELSSQLPIRSRLMLTMGRVYRSLGLYEPSARLLQDALQMARKTLGADHPDVSTYELELAWVYLKWNRLDEALPLCRKALATRRKAYGSDNAYTAFAIQVLGTLLRNRGEYTEAKQLLEESLAIRERVLGSDHTDVATSLYHLGWLAKVTRNFESAKRYYERALPIYERRLGADHPNTIWCLNDLAIIEEDLGDLNGALQLQERILAIRERVFGPDHPDVSASLNNLGVLLWHAGNYERASPVLQRSLAIREKAMGADNLEVADTLNNLALVYQATREYSKAQSLYERSLKIKEKALGADHPGVASTLFNLGELSVKVQEYARAKAYFERSLRIDETAYGLNHPEVGDVAYNLADMYCRQGKYSEAEPFFQRSLVIREKTLKPDDPRLVDTLEAYAALLRKISHVAEAEKLEIQAKSIRQGRAGKVQ